VPAAAARSAGGTLVVDLPHLLSIDPVSAFLPGTNQLLAATCLKVVNYPDKPGARGSRAVPEASKYPTVSKNRRTWTFRIKPGLKFSDGSTVDAGDVAWTINRQIWLQSPGGRLLTDVVGYKALANHQRRTAAGVRAEGNSLVITLAKPDNGLPLQLATNYFCILATGPSYIPINAPIPTAGPYQVQSFTIADEAVLIRNPYYTGSRPRGAGSIVMRQRTPADAQQDAQSGAAQIVLDGGLPQSSLAQFHKAGTLQAHPALETDYIALNTSRPLFRSPELRQAFNYGIDRPALLRQRGAFAGQRTDQILPPGMTGFRDAKIYPLGGPNLQQARSLVGKRCSRKKPCRGIFVTCNLPDCVKEANLIHNDLAAFGIDLKVRPLAPQAYYNSLHRKGEPFDAVIASRSADYLDPSDFIDALLDSTQFRSPDNANFSYFRSPAVTRALGQARNQLGTARYKAYAALDIDITAHAAPWAAFDNRNVREFVSKHVKNYVFQPVYGGVDLGAVQLR
jgi:ABC-type transport system substrate-binding protein